MLYGVSWNKERLGITLAEEPSTARISQKMHFPICPFVLVTCFTILFCVIWLWDLELCCAKIRFSSITVYNCLHIKVRGKLCPEKLYINTSFYITSKSKLLFKSLMYHAFRDKKSRWKMIIPEQGWLCLLWFGYDVESRSFIMHTHRCRISNRFFLWMQSDCSITLARTEGLLSVCLCEYCTLAYAKMLPQKEIKIDGKRDKRYFFKTTCQIRFLYGTSGHRIKSTCFKQEAWKFDIQSNKLFFVLTFIHP